MKTEADIRAEECDRLRTILAHPAAVRQRDLALRLAFDAGMPADRARDIMNRFRADQSGHLGEMLASMNPDLGDAPWGDDDLPESYSAYEAGRALARRVQAMEEGEEW